MIMGLIWVGFMALLPLQHQNSTVPHRHCSSSLTQSGMIEADCPQLRFNEPERTPHAFCDSARHHHVQRLAAVSGTIEFTTTHRLRHCLRVRDALSIDQPLC